MDGNQGARRYRETDIGTMTREKMVVLLYEKMVSDLEEAVRAIEADDKVAFTQRVNHSQRIVVELRGALDHAVGGEIARNLEAIYDFLFREHLALLLDREPRRAKSCIAVLQPLLEAWRRVPPGSAGNAERGRGHLGGDTGVDPASSGGSGGGGVAAAPRAGAPEAIGGRPHLLSVSA